MTVINRSALLPYNAHQLFDLVSDVESYPSYMTGCAGVRILRREDNLLEARLDLAQGGIKQSFSTQQPHDCGARNHAGADRWAV